MEDTIKFLSSFLGIGLGSTLAVLVLCHIAKESLVKAVEQAGRVELEHLKKRIFDEQETRRQSFAAELEQARASAARDLERFKAELTMQAELRRQVAIRKVNALAEIVRMGEPLLRETMNASLRDDALLDIMREIGEFRVKVRDFRYLLDQSSAERLDSYSCKLLDAYQLWRHDGDSSARAAAKAAYEEMLELIRSELGVQPEDRSNQIERGGPPPRPS